jgi:hypothetical protein
MLLELKRLEVSPGLEVLPRYLAASKTIGRNKMSKAFRHGGQEQHR